MLAAGELVDDGVHGRRRYDSAASTSGRPFRQMSDRVSLDHMSLQESPESRAAFDGSSLPRAAESSPAGTLEAAAGTVVIKRKRPKVSRHVGRQEAQSSASEPRPPKVHRVEPSIASTALQLGASAPPSPVSGVAPDDDAGAAAGAAVSTEPVLVTGRRPRQPKHGKVTIIRPVEPAEVRSSEGGASTSEPSSSDALADRRILDGLESFMRASIEEHGALLARIADLKREASAARKAEAAKAVRWIRRAIADHHLSARDLGF